MDPLVAQGHTGSLADSHGAPLVGQLGVGSRAVPGLVSFEPDQWHECDHGVKSVTFQIGAQFVTQRFRVFFIMLISSAT